MLSALKPKRQRHFVWRNSVFSYSKMKTNLQTQPNEAAEAPKSNGAAPSVQPCLIAYYSTQSASADPLPELTGKKAITDQTPRFICKDMQYIYICNI